MNSSPPSMDQKPDQKHDRQHAAPRRSAARWLKRLAAGLLILVLLLAISGYALVKTEWGGRAAWQLASRVLGGKLSGEVAGGTLADGLRLRNVAYRDARTSIAIDSLAGAWRLTRSPLELVIASLEVGTVDVSTRPSSEPAQPAQLPAQIRLPLRLDLQSASIGRLRLHQDAGVTELQDIRLRAASDQVHHRIELRNLDTPWGKLQGALNLDGGAPPFPLQGNLRYGGAWQDTPYRAVAELSGSLQQLGIRLDAGGGELAGNASIEATPFAPLPFSSAQLELRHLDPHQFAEAAPAADLTLSARLVPEQAAGKPPADLGQLTVSGPLSIANSRPGPLDRGLLPLENLQAQVRMDAQRQQLSGILARLAGGATLQGGGELRTAKGGQGSDGEFALRARGLDLHSLYGTLKPTRLDGPLEVRLAGENQDIKLRLEQPGLAFEADAGILPQEIRLRSARLQAGQSRLELAGTMGRDADSAYAVDGKLTRFDPSTFMATVQAAPEVGSKANDKADNKAAKPMRIPQADINMDFNAKGALKPELRADVRFDIRDSSYEHLPMSGGGMLQLAGKQVPAADVALSVAGNRLAAKGGFGAPGRKLDFNIDAPQLDRLGFGLSGLLRAAGEVGGSLEHPVAQASLQGRQLAFGEYSAAQLSGKIDTRGLPGSDPQAHVELALDGRTLQAAELRLDAVSAAVNGSYAQHAIKLNASGKLHGQALDARLAAHGALAETPKGLAWSGNVDTLENRGLPRIAMQRPLALAISPELLRLGATRLDIEQARIDLGGLEYRQDGHLSSKGTLNGLDIGRLLAVWQQLSGQQPPVKTDLVLDGQWDIALADSASGSFAIERRRGDIVLPVGSGASALGLGQLRLRGELRGDALRLDLASAAERIGNVAGQVQVGLRQADGGLGIGPASTLSGKLTAAVPRLQTLASLTGPRIALDGSLRAELAIAGTAGTPVISGEVLGERLALTLYDQGVRLRDGVARIAIRDNIAEFREVLFRGGDGTLRATGRIPLDQSRPDMAATIVAERLQLLADPSAQLTVSGQATVANVNDQLRVNGSFTVDRALFSLPEKSAPKLDDDVVVYRAGDQPEARKPRGQAGQQPASPYAPYVDVQIALGNDFRFRGSGADLRLAGSLTLTSAPLQALQAVGTVRIAEGRYKAFGVDLAIERGLLNFQGPLTNPNLNILAMRRNQDVAAGVQVSGTANAPRVTLVSEPNVADEEKLSWLVFGHGGSSAGTGAQGAARGAALGLLNKLGGEKIAKSVGLDQLSFGTSEYGMGSEQVISLGKEISDKLAIGYEQSLAGASGVLRLTYQLSRRWSVVLRGGQIAGLDLFYSRRFDRFREEQARR